MSTSESLILSTSQFLETVYFGNRAGHEDALTVEQVRQSNRLCKEMYEVILGPDSEVVPPCLENVRALTVLPMLVSAGYNQLSLSLLDDINFTVGTFNIESERNRINRIFMNATTQIIEHLLYEKGIFNLMLDSYDVEKYVMSSLPLNSNEGIYALTQTLLEKIENELISGGGDFGGLKFNIQRDESKIQHIMMLISHDNNQQLSQAVDFEGMSALVDIILRLDGNYICKLRHEELLDTIFNDERFCSVAYCRKILIDVCNEYWFDNKLFDFVDHIIDILPVREAIKGLADAKSHIWGEQGYAMPMIERLYSACQKQGDTLNNYPEELANIVQKSVEYKKKVGLAMYVFLYRKGLVMGDISSRSMLSVLKEVHGMTPLQMLMKPKPIYKPFMRMLVQEVLSKTKKTPLSLLENVDDWVRPYVMEMLV